MKQLISLSILSVDDISIDIIYNKDLYYTFVANFNRSWCRVTRAWMFVNEHNIEEISQTLCFLASFLAKSLMQLPKQQHCANSAASWIIRTFQWRRCRLNRPSAAADFSKFPATVSVISASSIFRGLLTRSLLGVGSPTGCEKLVSSSVAPRCRLMLLSADVAIRLELWYCRCSDVRITDIAAVGKVAV